ncbi:MAG TPA: alpha-amylase family glycosyl hydrolase, partial [Verrucomicrobiae bacterium]|nr:alpha-amylase family glycosyl hydrolase [Verrucomicrobiae bacterium]
WHAFLKTFHGALDALSPQCVASYAFGNHDQHRIVTRLGEPTARSAAVLLLTLPGMAFIYNGDELGMKNGKIPPDMVQDPGAVGGEGRDPERTPLQWSPDKNAGFTTADRPWLPVADNYKTHNVETESKDPDSFLSLYRQLGRLRNQSAAMRYGALELIETGHTSVLGFARVSDEERHTILINFSNKPLKFTMKSKAPLGDFRLSSDPQTRLHIVKNGKIEMQPHEAAVFARM